MGIPEMKQHDRKLLCLLHSLIVIIAAILLTMAIAGFLSSDGVVRTHTRTGASSTFNRKNEPWLYWTFELGTMALPASLLLYSLTVLVRLRRGRKDIPTRRV